MGREKRECLKLPSNSHRLLFAIVVTIESEEGSFPIAQCQPVLFFPSQARRRVRFDGGILSTVKEYILDKNGEKVKLKNGNYKTRKIDTVDWNEQGKAEEWRKSWADITNKAYTKLKKNKQDTFYNEHTAEIVLFEIAKNI